MRVADGRNLDDDAPGMAGVRSGAVPLVAALVAAGGLLALAVLQPLAGTQTDFSLFNRQWNGASGLADDLQSRGALQSSYGLAFGQDDGAIVAYRSLEAAQVRSGAATILILGPSVGPTPDEVVHLRAFVQGGGQLLIADDFGPGNAFLEGIGAATRIDGRPVRDLSYSRQPTFVVTRDMAATSLSVGVDHVVLGNPSFLVPGPQAQVLASTGPSAWAETKRDGIHTLDEPEGDLPWMVVEPVGRGSVLVLSDPSLLINGMADLGSNRVLQGNIVDWAVAQDRRIVWDEAHRSYADPVRWTDRFLEDLSGPATWILAAVLGVGFLAAIAGGPVWQWFAQQRNRLLAHWQPPPVELDLVAQVRARDATLDENAITRIRLDWRERRGGLSDAATRDDPGKTGP